MKSSLITLSLLLFSTQVLAESNFLVKAEIFSGDKSVGSPSFVVKGDAEAGANVDGRYELSLLASSVRGDEVLINSNLKVGEQTYSPSVMVELGKVTKLKMDSITLVILVNEA